MQQDKEKTKVIFRKDKRNGEIDAIFPEIIGTHDPYTMSCYAHIGQHSTCSMCHVWYNTIKPTEEEIQPLKKELEELFGYNLDIKYKMTQKHLKTRKKILKSI